MNLPQDDHELETLLTEALGPPPRDDIDAWRKRYPTAIAWLHPQRISAVSQRRKRMQRILVLATALAAGLLMWLGLPYLTSESTGTSAFAKTVEQIREARDITWTTTVYERTTSKDGQRYWYEANVFQNAYKAPGLYRETSLDPQGNVRSIEITDTVQRKVLTLDPAAKTATIAEIRPHQDADGPFGDARRALKEAFLQFVERRKTPAGEVNVFRKAEGEFFFDYWIDPKSKQLVEYRINQNPKVTLADYENDPNRDAAPEKDWSTGTIIGSIDKDIVYNAHLDDAFVSL